MQSSDVAQRLFPTTAGPYTPLDQAAASQLRASAASDAGWSYRSAILSIVSGLNGLEAGYRSWPVVNLYYSVFYAIRSILLSNGVCLYYLGNKPMQIDAAVGQMPTKLNFHGAGSSHIAAFRVFETKFPIHPLNGQIDFEVAPQWMRHLREAVNYKHSQMNMDDRLGYFARVDRSGVRKSLATYWQDLPLYAFLPDDAPLAFPLYAAQQALSSLPKEAAEECRGLIEEISARARDKAGPITTFAAYVPTP